MAEPQPEPEPASAAPSEHVRWLQSTLNRAMGGALPIDGVMSAAVRDAIRDFQRKNRLPVSGYIGPDTDAALRRADGGSEIGELEFERESELAGDCSWAIVGCQKACAGHHRSSPRPTRTAGTVPHLSNRDGGFYTGCSLDLRERIIQHLWSLNNLGVDQQTTGLRL